MSGHHIKNGEFLSDKYTIIRNENGENVSPNKIVLSFNDREARLALHTFAVLTKDKELGADILEVLNNFKEEEPNHLCSYNNIRRNG